MARWITEILSFDRLFPLSTRRKGTNARRRPRSQRTILSVQELEDRTLLSGAPMITSLVNTQVPPGYSATSGSANGGEKIQINGSGFTGATSVLFGGTGVTPANFTIVNDGEIIALDPPGTGTVQVKVSVPSQPLSNTSPFTYVPTPTLSTTPNPSSFTGGGPTLQDTATLAGGSNPQGSITFTLLNPTGTVVDTENVTVTGDGQYHTTTGYTLPAGAAGNYQWNASYTDPSHTNYPVSDINNPNELVQGPLAFPFTIAPDVAAKGVYMAMFGNLQQSYTPSAGPSMGVPIASGTNVYLVKTGTPSDPYDYAPLTADNTALPMFVSPSAPLPASDVIGIPNVQIKGARVVIGVGTPPTLPVQSNSVTVPTPANQPSNIYDFFEFSYLPVGTPAVNTLTINTSQIDQFGFPIQLNVTTVPQGPSQVGVQVPRQGVLGANGSFNQFLQSSTAQGASDYEELTTDGFGNQLNTRISAPADFLQNNPVSGVLQTPPPIGTGTITSSGTTVTGISTTFLTQIAAGDYIGNSTSGFSKVATAPSSNTSLTLSSPFPNGDITSASAFSFLVPGTLTPNTPYYYAIAAVNSLAGTGTITSSGTSVTGTGTKFTSQVQPGDLIGNSTSGYSQVKSVSSDTSLILAGPFPNGDISSAAAFNIQRQANVSDQIVEATSTLAGTVALAWSPPTTPTIASYNIYRGTVGTTAQAGTIKSTGTSVTGTGTTFTSLQVGEYIGNSSSGYSQIATISSDTSLTLLNPFPQGNISSSANFNLLGSTVTWALAGTTPVQEQVPAGTITSSSTTVTGTGTSFNAGMVGQLIGNSTSGFSRVAVVSSATSLTLSSPFPNGDISSPTAFNAFVGVPFADTGAAGSAVSPPFDPLSTFFDSSIAQLFSKYTNGGLNLIVTDGTNDGFQYQVSGQTVADPIATSDGTAGNTLLRFTVTNVTGAGTPPIPVGSTFYVYKPFFNTNTYIASDPAAPSWMPNTNVTATGMMFGAEGVFADNLQQQQSLLPKLQMNGINTGVNAALWSVALGSIENQLDAALTRGIATTINPVNWANQPTGVAAKSGTGGTLSNSQAYYYVVTTLNANGESTVSNEVSFTPTNGSVQLTWLPVGNGLAPTLGYNIYRGTAPGEETQLIGTVGGQTNTNFMDTGSTYPQTAMPPASGGTPPTNNAAAGKPNGSLAVGQTYYYEVTALVGGTESGPSNEASYAPTAGQQSTLLTWTQVNGATQYNIYRGTSPGQENQLIGTVFTVSGQVNTSFLDRGATYPSNTSPPIYYPAGSVSDLYAEFFHQPNISFGGYAYGSPFDDQGGQSSTVSAVQPLNVQVTIPAWTASLTSPGTLPTVLNTTTTITINGAGFDPNPANNTVTFYKDAGGTMPEGTGSVTAVSADGTQLTFTFTQLTPLATGTLYADVQTAGGGDSGIVAVATVVANTTLPTVILNSAPPVNTVSTTAQFSFVGAASPPANLVYLVSLDGGSFVSNGQATTKSYTGLTLGTHTFQVVARDPAGNTSTPATYSWNVTTAAQIVVKSGGNQSATVSTSFTQPIIVTVEDAFGNPVAGATVFFLVQPSGVGAGATLGSGVSNASGLVSVSATANLFAGSYRVSARSSTVASAPFTLTNTLAPFTPNYTDLNGFVTQIATTTNANGTLTIFGIGGDNAVYYRQENIGNDPTSFGPWTSLGGFAKGLAVAPQGNGQPPAVFVIGGDNAAWVNLEDGSGWHSLGGSVKQLAAARDGNGKLELFAIGSNNAVYVDQQTSGTNFLGWNGLGGFVTQIAVGQNGGSDQTLQVFGIGGDNALWTNKQTSLATPTVFTGWNSLGGFVKQFTVGQNLDGTLQLFAVGGDNGAYTTKQTAIGNNLAAGFTGWQSLGGFVSQLTVARNSDGTLQFFGIGGDGAIWSRSQSTPGATTSANFSVYQSFGGFVKQVVASTNPYNQTVQFFGIGGDNAVYTKAQNLLVIAQLLAGTPVAGSDAASLTAAELAPIVTEAEARWEALGVSASQFQGLQFQIGTIGNGWLGAYLPGTIYLDPTADGYGWFVDPTPGLNNEFAGTGNQERALPNSAAAGHVDLLTVVMHELGHGLGLPDTNSGPDIMAEYLAPGIRRTPTIADVDAAFRS